MTDRTATDRPATDRIEITGLRVRGHHGVFDHEKRDGQPFVVDVVLEADLSRPAVTDELGDTIDYGTLAQRIADEVRATRFDLIERLAGHLLDVAMSDPMVTAAEIRIAKPEAPVTEEFGEVAVRLRRERQ
ncbi:dihydroneopterin aldolase [Euzebya rosea]|uniref:dihydroneopterin aldolase n=1 Tax=Euzebya rosea TaxID=2052804 RepID=UPI000D3ED078|nr:dihydroneopterin aldolase [Euzebya rosea]